MKKLDSDAPLVEVAKKLKVLQSYQPYIKDMERRMAILHKVEPVLENAIKILNTVIDPKSFAKVQQPTPPPQPIYTPASSSNIDLSSLL